MKFIKIPVEVDAIQWTGENHREMYNFLEDKTDSDKMATSGINFIINHNSFKGGLIIKTMSGEHTAKIGDWVIKEMTSGFYPCDKEIFERTYDKVEAK